MLLTCYYIFTAIFTQPLAYVTSSSAPANQNENTTYGERGKNVNITFKAHAQHLYSFSILSDNETIATTTTNSFELYRENTFRFRSSTVVHKAANNINTYLLCIHNLTLKDDETIFVGIALYNCANSCERSTESRKKLRVFEKLSRCSQQPMKISSVNLKVEETLCGHPRPSFHWYMDGVRLREGVPRKIGNLKYVFTKIFDDTSLCGKNISYVATGYGGSKISNFAPPFYNFTPSIVPFTVQTFESCIFLHWRTVKTGSCTAKYIITMFDKDDSLIFSTQNVSSSKTTFKYCSYPHETVVLIKKIGMQVLLNRNIGKMTTRCVFFEEAVHVHYYPPTSELVGGIMAVVAVMVIAYIVSYHIIKKRKEMINRIITLQNLREEGPFMAVEDTDDPEYQENISL